MWDKSVTDDIGKNNPINNKPMKNNILKIIAINFIFLSDILSIFLYIHLNRKNTSIVPNITTIGDNF